MIGLQAKSLASLGSMLPGGSAYSSAYRDATYVIRSDV